MLQAILDFLKKNEISPLNIVDGTFGRGGHSQALLKEYPNSRVLGFDRDPESVEYGLEHFNQEISTQRMQLIKANFMDIKNISKAGFALFQNQAPDFVLLDLGVSSPQLDVSDRGFSFYHTGPLDMRMDLEQNLTAAMIVNEWSEKELSDLFYNLGEIKFPNKVVRAICHRRKDRPIETTTELSDIIVHSDGWRKKGKHPATQYFLALRLKVNNELENIENSLKGLVEILSPNGLLMVITFHSVEDRIVKHLFKSFKDMGKILTKKVIQAERLEIKDNPRARSAKLRIFQRGEDLCEE